LNLSFASVGTGLTGTETQILNRQVQLLEYNLQPEKVVTNGLLLYLDGLNPSSYPGTGNIWYDLSGNGYHGTLIGNLPFNYENAGNMLYTANSMYVINSSFNITPVNNELSITMWYRTPNNRANDMLIDLCSSISPGSNRDLFSIRQNWGSGNNNTAFYFNSTAGFQYIQLPSRVINNTWNHITYTKVGTTRYAYLNGVNVASGGATGNIRSIDRYIVGIDNIFGSGFVGNIAAVQVYNRGLSSSEVLQNFNATRGRFGI
jgi:hypothetical protein